MKPKSKFRVFSTCIFFILSVESAICKDETELGQVITSFLGILENVSAETLGNNIIDIELYEHETFAKFVKFFNESDHFFERYKDISTETINRILQNLPAKLHAQISMVQTREHIMHINAEFEKVKNYLRSIDHIGRIEQLTLETFAKSALQGLGSIETMLEKVDMHFTSYASNDLLEEINKELKNYNSDLFCNSNQSPNQVIQNLYNTLQVIEFKGFITMHLAYIFLRSYHKGEFELEVEMMNKKFQNRTLTRYQTFMSKWNKFSTVHWLCDPDNHVEGKTYVQITRLLQGIVQNEVNLNHKGTCKKKCHDYSYTTVDNCYKGSCDRNSRCSGQIHNCKKIGPLLHLCPPPPSSPRRYSFIKTVNLQNRPYQGFCPSPVRRMHSWNRWFVRCDYCFCLCDAPDRYSDRYFSLRPALSDINNNRVVTGVRMAKEDRIIHIQIQQGTLKARGVIDPSTVEWVSINKFKFTDRGVKEGVDHHKLTFSNRNVGLDDVKVGDDCVVTGVKFELVTRNSQTIMLLKVLQTPFNYTTGKLAVGKQKWIGMYEFRNRKHQVNENFLEPTKALTKNILDSKPGEYISFTHTSIYGDSAQTTIPFVDIQPVSSIVPSALTGIGIYHKGTSNYGGYIGLKTFSFNQKEYMRPLFENINWPRKEIVN